MGVFDVYWYEKNMQGDVVAVYNGTGTKLVSYVYDAYGNFTRTLNGIASTHVAAKNPFTYRGYYYDYDLELYYVTTRYYDSDIGRWLSLDKYVSTGQGLSGYNMFAYCGNDPVNRADPTGEAWWHWAIAAGVVVACAAAVVITAGGALPGIAAVASVAAGAAAATTASTVAAGAFIGSATVLGAAAITAAANSSSIEDFNNQGNWGTVAMTAGGAALGAIYEYSKLNGFLSKTKANPGKPFAPNGKSIQEGVDPNTLIPNKDLSQLSLQRMQNAVKYAGNQAISVTRNGVILDGHHRVAYAIKHGQMVDVIVEAFK